MIPMQKRNKSPPCDIKPCRGKVRVINVQSGLKLCDLHRNIYDLIGKERFMERFKNIQK